MSAQDEHAKLLNETNIFAGVDRKTLDVIAALAREISAQKNEVIYHPGDDAVDVYILLTGSVLFTLADKTGIISSGTLLKSRSVFGWAALVPDHPKRLGDAKCLENSSLLALDGDKVLHALRADPASGLLVMERLCAMIARNFMEQQS